MRPLLEIDERTANYVLQTRRPFEDLRQVAGQLAGFLVLSASGANTASPDHRLLETAAELHGSAVDGVHSARPSPRALAHHRSLMDAGAELGLAIAAARKGIDIDPVLIPLRRAYGHLQNATHELPGFEMVSFQHACCAVGQSPRRIEP
jgi:hypothetical protein